MVTIFLHGMLGRKFGKEWKLEVTSIAEGLHAIDVNTNGAFRTYFAENKTRQYKMRLGEHFISEEIEVKGPCGRQHIHIVPLIKGRNSGIGKIFAAIAIVALLAWNPAGWAYAAETFGSGLSGLGAAATTVGGLTGAALIAGGVAASLFLGGISQLLAPKIGFDTNSSDGSRASSFDFNGNVATVQQGNPVPVAYGRVLIHPLPISVSQFYEDYTAGGVASTSATVTTNQDAGFDGSANNGNPALNPVGQNVTVKSSTNLYLNNFSDASSTKSIGPSVIPGQSTPYPTQSS